MATSLRRLELARLSSKMVAVVDFVFKRLPQVWFAVAGISLLLFVYYIVAFYYRSIIHLDFQRWNTADLIHGYIQGDYWGNLQFALHVMAAGLMTITGLVAMLPAVRNRWPTIHRMTGRAFLLMAVSLSIGGLALIWIRGTRLSVVGAMATSLNGVLIIVFSGFTLYYASQRRIAEHRRWALRTFLVANGVWMFRLLLTFWYLTTRGWGTSSILNGPADIMISYGSFMFPLLVLEIYLKAQDTKRIALKLTSVCFLAASIIITGVGTWTAYMMLWRPHI